jgi:ADP-heptose:LPS heptosyltransferase
MPLPKIIKTLMLESLSQQKIMLVGGKEEIAIAEEILRNINNPNVVSAVGKTTIGQSAYIISKSQCVITNDTGMMHIAAALKKPIVSLWGNTIPEFGMYPYYGQAAIKNSIVEVKDLGCRPCSKLGYSQCPKGHFKCMNDIDVAEIQESVLRIINA